MLVGAQNSEAGRLLHRHPEHRHGAGGARLLVRLQHLGVVHLVDVVAGKDGDVFRVVALDEFEVLIYGVGGSPVPVAAAATLVGREHEGAASGAVEVPGLTAADVFRELEGLVLGENTDGVYPGIDAVREGEVNNPVLSAEGHRGLRKVLREGEEPAALTPGKKHRNHFLSQNISSFVFWREFAFLGRGKRL